LYQRDCLHLGIITALGWLALNDSPSKVEHHAAAGGRDGGVVVTATWRI